MGVGAGLLAFKVRRARRYALGVWLGFDKFANAARGGSHLETVSSCLGKSVHYNKSTVLGLKFIDKFVVKALDAVDKDHCRKAIQWNVNIKG